MGTKSNVIKVRSNEVSATFLHVDLDLDLDLDAIDLFFDDLVFILICIVCPLCTCE